MALTKYTPQFIERQYIPTNVNAAIDVMGKMQGQYDRGVDMQQQALSEAYGMKSTQGFEAGRNQFAENLKSQIDKAIESRGGDAGAALRDIQGAIINAKKDPFIRANERMLEKTAELDKQLANNPDLEVLRDVRGMKYAPGMSDQDIDYQIYDPESMDKSFESEYSKLRGVKGATSLRDLDGYTVASQQVGVTPEKIANMKSIETYNNLIQKSPQLAAAVERNPELKQRMINRINSKLDTLYGGVDENIVDKPDRVSGASRAGTVPMDGMTFDTRLDQTGYGLLPDANTKDSTIFSEKLDNQARKLSSAAGLGEKTYKEIEDMALQSVGNLVDKNTYSQNPLVQEEYIEKNKGNLELKRKYSDIYKVINDKLKAGSKEFAIPTYQINKLKYASGKSINELDNIQKGLDEDIESNIDKFTPITRQDKNSLGEIASDFKVVEVSPNYKRNGAGTVVYVMGKDKNKKIVRARMALNPAEDLYEQNITGFLDQMNPIFSKEYEYAKRGDDYLKELENSLSLYPKGSQEVIRKFIDKKREQQ